MGIRDLDYDERQTMSIKITPAACEALGLAPDCKRSPVWRPIPRIAANALEASGTAAFGPRWFRPRRFSASQRLRAFVVAAAFGAASGGWGVGRDTALVSWLRCRVLLDVLVGKRAWDYTMAVWTILRVELGVGADTNPVATGRPRSAIRPPSPGGATRLVRLSRDW